MNEITITSANSSCKIASEPELDLINLEKYSKRMIPGSKIENVIRNDVFINVRKGQTTKINEKYPTLELITKNIKVTDVLALAEHGLERDRQERGIYNLHASAVSDGNKTTIIHGPSKAGKTLLSMVLQVAYGLRFEYNERCLINFKENELVAGVEKLDIPEFHKNYLQKNYQIDSINLETTKNSLPINNIIIPTIHSQGKNLEVFDLEKGNAYWLLYPEFTTRIRGSTRLLKGENNIPTIPLQSLDNQKISEKRIEELRMFIDNTTIQYVKGDIHSICKYVSNSI